MPICHLRNISYYHYIKPSPLIVATLLLPDTSAHYTLYLCSMTSAVSVYRSRASLTFLCMPAQYNANHAM